MNNNRIMQHHEIIMKKVDEIKAGLNQYTRTALADPFDHDLDIQFLHMREHCRQLDVFFDNYIDEWTHD